jgi:hypothetical protein
MYGVYPLSGTKWGLREKYHHCKVKVKLSISFNNFFGNGSL